MTSDGNYLLGRRSKKVSVLVIIGLLLVCFLTVALTLRFVGGGGVWWNTNWQYRKSITINHAMVSANLTNFPMLVNITDSNLATYAQSNGNDIAFTDYSGNKLNHEIESYTSSNGRLVAWVNLPNLSNTTDMILYMYYGNPSAANQQNANGVWDSNFKGVWHLGAMDSSSSSGVHDSTSNGNNGTYTGSNQDVAGIIDGADSFSTSEYVKGPDSSSLRITGSLTIEAWVQVNTASPSANEYIACKFDYGNSNRAYALFHSGSSSYLPLGEFVLNVSPDGTSSNAKYVGSGSAATVGSWDYVVGEYDGTYLRIYVNGTQSTPTSYSSGLFNGNASFTFGNNMNNGAIGSNPFSGTVDEVRISNSVRSGAWISTCFNNQNSPGSFYTVGTQETQTLQTYTLTVSIVGQGSVILNPPTGPYTYGTNVILTASAATDWSFQNWTGDLNSSANPITINMTSNKSVTATFTENQVVTLVGTPTQIGTTWAQENRPTILTDFNSFMSSVGQTNATLEAFAQIFINNATTLNCTYWVTEANAIADYLGLDRGLFIAFLSGRYRNLAQYFGDCTSFAIVPPATANSEIIFHKTRDNTEEPQSAYIMWTTGLPDGQQAYKFFAEMGVADTGLSYFVNDHGLAGSCDQGGSCPAKYDGLMNHYTLRYIAEHCATVSEVNAALHYLVDSGFTAGGTIISNYLFVDKNGNILHIADNGYSIVTDDLNPQLDYHGTSYPGIYFTIDRGIPGPSPEDALVQNYGNITVQLADSSLVAKHSAMSFSTSLSGATFLINPTHPDTLTSIFISLPAWGYSVPTLLAATSTPRALMNGTVYEYQKSAVPYGTALNQAFLNTMYNEWAAFLSNATAQVDLGQDVGNSTNTEFLYSVNQVLGVNVNTPPEIANPSPPECAGPLGLSLSQLSFTLTDAQGDLMNYSAVTSPDVIGGVKTGTGVSSGTTINLPITVALQYSTQYTWQVNATDPAGSGQTTTETFKFTTGAQPVMLNPWLSGWQYCRLITIDHTKITADQTNFPVLIDITDTGFTSKIKPDGSDILFMSGTGLASKLDHQIELYQSATAHLVAWVRIPSLSSTVDTTIYMYYGNPSATNQQNVNGVWNSNFMGVWHLGETSGTVYDSTANGNNGTYTGSHQDVTGKIDGADSFNGVNENVVGPDSSSLRITGDLTIEAWVKVNTASPAANEYFACKYDMNNQRSYALAHSTNGVFFMGVSLNGGAGGEEGGFYEVDSTTIAVPGAWYYVVGVHDTASNQLRLYVNGQLQGTKSFNYTIYSSNAQFSFGSLLNSGAIGNAFGGTVDEVRISNDLRSNSWISTCFNSQNNPNSFYSVGSEETSLDVASPSPSDGAVGVRASLSELNFTLTDAQGNLVNYEVTTSPDAIGGIKSGTGVSSGTTIHIPITSSLLYSTLYTWQVQVVDPTSEQTRTRTFNFTTAAQAGLWWDDHWLHRESITINHTMVQGGSLTGFPVLIDITSVGLRDKAQSSGNDIVFTDCYGSKLNYEIELYSSSSGHLIAWVNVPNLSSTVDTILYMYYGNPSASSQQNPVGVWDSNFAGVWHLGEVSGTVFDSTANGNNGVYIGSEQDAFGKIDGADKFNSVNESVVGPNSLSLDITGSLTIEAWIKPDTASPAANAYFACKYDLNNQRSYSLFLQTNGKLGFRVSPDGTINNVAAIGNTTVVAGSWYYVNGVYNYAAQQLSIYVNGVLDGSASYTSSIYNSSAKFSFGTLLNNGAFGGNAFQGTVDEVRISNTARSIGWIQTCFNEENNASSFYNVGTEETHVIGIGLNPTTITCRKFDQGFTMEINVTNVTNVTGLNFEVCYNTTLLTYAGITWNAWGSGTIITDLVNGIITGTTSGTALSGNQTLVTVQFTATYQHIWMNESDVPGWQNNQSGAIYVQSASASYASGPGLGYVRGGASNQINAGPDFTYTFSPIQGDVNNDGTVSIGDLRTVAAYFDVKQGDSLWSAASAYDLNGNGVIDIYDLVLISADFGYTYP